MQKGDRVQVKAAWDSAGRKGIVLGDSVETAGQMWTPVKWDDEEDPDFFKTIGLVGIPDSPKMDICTLFKNDHGAWTVGDHLGVGVTLYGLNDDSKGRHLALPSHFLRDVNDFDISEFIRSSGIPESDS